MSRITVVLYAVIALNACTETNTVVRREAIGHGMTWARPAAGPATIGGKWERSPGRLTGRLQREVACQAVETDFFREHTVKVTKAAWGSYLAAIFGGAYVAMGVVGILEPDAFRGDCDGGGECGTMDYILGPWFLAMGTPFLASGSYYIFRDPPSEVISTRALPSVPGRRAGRVTCGSGPIVGLALMALRGDQPVATAVSDALGQVTFTLSPDVAGELAVVVWTVPNDLLDLARAGDLVGTVP